MHPFDDPRAGSWPALMLMLLVPISLMAADTDDGADPGSEHPAVTMLRDYLRVDTRNPPGNESAATAFLGAILAAEGIAFKTVEPVDGRGNLWATLKGGDEPALLLLHHTDVVTADEAFWDVPAFEGVVRDGYIYGRGALDMKSHGILHLSAFLALHRAGKPLKRDVIFMATADEEAGSGVGMGWLIDNRPGLFDEVGMALTEGGHGTVVGDRIALGIEVTQKIPLWLRLEAAGPAGHGSTPRVDSAVSTLLAGLNRIQAHQFEARIVPIVDAYFKRLAPNMPGPLGASFADIATAVKNPGFRRELHENFANLSALIQNTCAITRLSGSVKVNVIGPLASADLDCRLLPDQDPVNFLAQLETIVADERISISPLLSFTPSASSPDTPLFAAIETVMSRHFPGVEAAPTITAGFTDSHHLRERGISSYGFAPVMIPLRDIAGYHGNNERISVENMERGAALMLEILEEVVY